MSVYGGQVCWSVGRVAPVLAAYDGAAELERGLDILLTGLAITLPPPAGARGEDGVWRPGSAT